MRKNDFGVDTRSTEKRDFLKRIGVLLGLAIFLTGLCSVAGVVFLIIGVRNEGIGVLRTFEFWMREFFWLVMLPAFAALVKIALDEKPFSVTLTWSIRIIGFLFVIGAAVFPRLEGYRSSGFEILSYKGVGFDGSFLLPGILLIILGNVIMAGFDMQREMDEIL